MACSFDHSKPEPGAKHLEKPAEQGCRCWHTAEGLVMNGSNVTKTRIGLHVRTHQLQQATHVHRGGASHVPCPPKANKITFCPHPPNDGTFFPKRDYYLPAAI